MKPFRAMQSASSKPVWLSTTSPCYHGVASLVGGHRGLILGVGRLGPGDQFRPVDVAVRDCHNGQPSW